MTEVRRRAGAAAIVLVMTAVATACSTEQEMREAAEVAEAPSASTSEAVDDLFSCDRTFTRASAPPADLVEQGGISEWAGGYVGDGYVVRRAASSPLGLVALVAGDVERARAELTARGVALVAPWDDGESTRSVTPFAQVDALVAQQLDPVLAEVRAATAGLAGVFEIRTWVPNGEVVVQWAEPVPAEVEALAGERPGRVRVAVEAVPHSRAAVDEAVARVLAADVGVQPTTAIPCADGTGAVVGIDPETLGDRRAELQDELGEVAGMPVLVVPLARGPQPVG
jgi:hypothetical protein